MLKVGLTGGIGCGKSTAVDAFRILGAPIVDADQIAKDLVKAGSPALIKINTIFGEDILFANGELNRTRLKEIVFTDSQALEKLEAIIHPGVRAEINKQIKELSAFPYVIIDIPLLVEKNYSKMFHRIIVVDCLLEQQISRVRKRDKLDESAIKAIISKQASRHKRLHKATDILDNVDCINSLNEQVKKLHADFLTQEKSE